MKTLYQIRKETWSLVEPTKQEVIFETTRKREVENYLNGLAKNLKKSGYFVYWVRDGYFRLDDFSTEYFICRTA